MGDPFAHAEHDGSSFSGSDDGSSKGVMESKELDVKKEHDALNKTLAKKENKAICVLRITVLLVLVTAAVLAAVIVYLFLKRSEEDELDDEFDDLTTRLIDGFLANAQKRVQVLDMYAISLTASALATNQSWPFVTFDDFEARSTAMRVNVESDYVGLYLYVPKEIRKAWEEYTVNNVEWLNQSFAYQEEFKRVHNRTVGVRAPTRRTLLEQDRDLQTANSEEGVLGDDGSVRNITFDGPQGMATELYRYGREDEEFTFVVEDGPGPYYPMWQVSPARAYSALDINYNVNDPYYSPAYAQALEVVQSTGHVVFAGVWNVQEDGTFLMDDDYDYREVPAASIFFPIFDAVQGEKEVVAVIDLDFEFGPLMSSVLPPNSNRLVAVISNPCDQVYTYEVTGERSKYLGPEDLHDPEYNSMMVSAMMTDFDTQSNEVIYNGPSINEEWCPWKIEVYATKDMEDEFLTDRPIFYMLVVLAVFAFVSGVFIIYDVVVEKRQKKVLTSAVNSDQIVASFFPKEFRDKLYAEKQEKAKAKKSKAKRAAEVSSKSPFQNTSSAFHSESAREFMLGDTNGNRLIDMPIQNSPPIAEHFQNCTVFFADIAGFTSWSSGRSPAQVFTLLETLYGAFDKLARRHKVFKIETIGDCYVSVTGLPDPQPDHAFLMMKFARDALEQSKKILGRLEGTLGPGTTDLGLRVGCHSGPVTAGILRGDKARFQLFGDTVNTASRMESLGIKGMVHISQDTADNLISIGKGDWVKKREDKIVAKGKGEMQTYFVYAMSGSGTRSVDYSSSGEHSSNMEDDDRVDVELALSKMPGTEDAKLQWAATHYNRVGWAAELFKVELRKIVSERGRNPAPAVSDAPDNGMEFSFEEVKWDDDLTKSLTYDDSCASTDLHLKKVEINQKVEIQIVEFIARLGYSHNVSPYYNFEHSCYVLMTTDNLVNQLKSPLGVRFILRPWAKFSMLLAMLIRDIDAPPLPHILGKGGDTHGRATSVKEHGSLDIAWKLLEEDNFSEMRESLFANKKELRRFWQLLVNLVLASQNSSNPISFDHNKELCLHQAIPTVLENIMLICYEAHYMQHWQNFVKWNDLLYAEYKGAYKKGIHSLDPDSFWRQHILDHFDEKLLPILRELDKEGILGAAGTENFKRASQNRQEWESLGNAPTATPMQGENNEGLLSAYVDC